MIVEVEGFKKTNKLLYQRVKQYCSVGSNRTGICCPAECWRVALHDLPVLHLSWSNPLVSVTDVHLLLNYSGWKLCIAPMEPLENGGQRSPCYFLLSCVPKVSDSCCHVIWGWIRPLMIKLDSVLRRCVCMSVCVSEGRQSAFEPPLLMCWSQWEKDWHERKETLTILISWVSELARGTIWIVSCQLITLSNWLDIIRWTVRKLSVDELHWISMCKQGLTIEINSMPWCALQTVSHLFCTVRYGMLLLIVWFCLGKR